MKLLASYWRNVVICGDWIFSVIHYQDAIFQRLVEDRFFQSVPSIIITAKGYPDLASRYLDYCEELWMLTFRILLPP
jgi:hypothetical protein